MQDHVVSEVAADPTAPGEGVPAHRYTAALANEIEARWQDRWESERTFWAPNPVGELAEPNHELVARPKLYVLDMFPYPSGVGLHVGHPLGYIATDIWARYQRMNGRNVLHAMGYDAFGLPAEQYAVQTGTHPRVTTEQNIAAMKAHYAEQERQRALESKARLAAYRAGGTYVDKPALSAPRSSTKASPRNLDKVLTRIGLNAEARKQAAAMLARSDMAGVRLVDGTVVRKLADGGISVRRGPTAYSPVKTAMWDATWRTTK